MAKTTTTYAVGQACSNGHKITGDLARENGAAFCPDCGAKTIKECAQCSASLRGDSVVKGPMMSVPVTWHRVPDYCHECGHPFPWMAAKLNAVNELAEAIEELTEHECALLAELVPHLVQETPRTKPAGFKVLTIVSKLKEPARTAMRDLLMDMVVEGGKQALGWG